MTWSARQYVAFEDERTRPARDLLAAIPLAEARTAVDLGCGPGNSTQALAARFPGARVTGIDASPDMIAAARRRLPEISFEVADAGAWTPAEPVDVILANALFQWIPDHGALFPRLVERLSAGGALAIQMPDNLEEPSHRAMREIAADGRWAKALASAAGQRTAIDTAGGYYGVLEPHCARVDVWRTVYHHPLAGPDAVVAWFEGSGLRPFLQPLDEAQRGDFLARYRDAIAAAYPALPDGTVLLPFPRLFIVAVR
jgi:trans-aconitate 2-methyltransferase